MEKIWRLLKQSMIVDINKLTLKNINENQEFNSLKEELLYKLTMQPYVKKIEMKNISAHIALLRHEGYKIETIPKVGYRLLEKEGK